MTASQPLFFGKAAQPADVQHAEQAVQPATGLAAQQAAGTQTHLPKFPLPAPAPHPGSNQQLCLKNSALEVHHFYGSLAGEAILISILANYESIARAARFS